jgi:hypothetical protein
LEKTEGTFYIPVLEIARVLGVYPARCPILSGFADINQTSITVEVYMEDSIYNRNAIRDKMARYSEWKIVSASSTYYEMVEIYTYNRFDTVLVLRYRTPDMHGKIVFLSDNVPVLSRNSLWLHGTPLYKAKYRRFGHFLVCVLFFVYFVLSFKVIK